MGKVRAPSKRARRELARTKLELRAIAANAHQIRGQAHLEQMLEASDLSEEMKISIRKLLIPLIQEPEPEKATNVVIH